MIKSRDDKLRDDLFQMLAKLGVAKLSFQALMEAHMRDVMRSVLADFGVPNEVMVSPSVFKGLKAQMENKDVQ